MSSEHYLSFKIFSRIRYPQMMKRKMRREKRKEKKRKKRRMMKFRLRR